MMRERKDRPVNRTVNRRSCFQRRQYPHATPATVGALEKDFVSADDKGVAFGEQFCARTSFPHRKDFRVCCAAKFSYRTNPAPRLARKTDQSAQINKSGVETRGATLGHDLLGAIPQEFAARDFIDRSSQIENARQNTGGVGFDDWDRLVKCETRDRVGGIFSDARQLPHLADRLWETATQPIYNRFRRGVKIASPSVVTQTLPGVEDVAFRSARQRGEIGKAAEPFIIVRKHRGYLGLLEHEFRDQDCVGIAGSPPREVAPVFAIPVEQGATKAIFRKNHR